jgi:hypothetical protein
MKKFAMIVLLLSINALAVTHININRGSSTTIWPGQEEVVVTCTSPVLSPCEVKVDSTNFKLFYIMQAGLRISNNYQEEGIKRLIVDFKKLGICP